ncbi:hypothetical protein [Nannocystis pusilla]|uniref:Uncharacterized protein n=1 Tax=Nannocystis pusilla TaxID=889268 RepID=A0ABS7TIF2_9BACT|nr:hypothetical protein [Nannocystis pusilla]MBZ5707981.1 hypothetical protein [Nannocystis pusilla]
MCPRCAAAIQVYHHVCRREGSVWWSESIRCDRCGMMQEADSDAGDPAARAAILAANGRWVLAVTDLGRVPIRVLRVIRDELGYRPAEARARLERLASGIRTELEVLLAKLVEEGATGECRRVE